jgi:hypothetical protein
LTELSCAAISGILFTSTSLERKEDERPVNTGDRGASPVLNDGIGDTIRLGRY